MTVMNAAINKALSEDIVVIDFSDYSWDVKLPTSGVDMVGRPMFGNLKKQTTGHLLELSTEVCGVYFKGEGDLRENSFTLKITKGDKAREIILTDLYRAAFSIMAYRFGILLTFKTFKVFMSNSGILYFHRAGTCSWIIIPKSKKYLDFMYSEASEELTLALAR